MVELEDSPKIKREHRKNSGSPFCWTHSWDVSNPSRLLQVNKRHLNVDYLKAGPNPFHGPGEFLDFAERRASSPKVSDFGLPRAQSLIKF